MDFSLLLGLFSALSGVGLCGLYGGISADFGENMKQDD
jgi:hypothetical protein